MTTTNLGINNTYGSVAVYIENNKHFLDKGATLNEDGMCVARQPKPCLPNCKD